ncbi:MAG: TolC family protein, partial [Bacteroidales bacterium]|nr:TolC family protein [Bacteroidales bacterium]
MKRLIFRILAITAIGTIPFFAQAQEPLQLTLDQALEIALSESNTIKIADMTVEKTGYAQKGSYASLYPNVNISGSYQRTLQKQVMVMDMGGQAMEIKVGRDNNISTSASASMPLVNAQLWESLNRSALDVEMAVEQARSSKIGMV